MKQVRLVAIIATSILWFGCDATPRSQLSKSGNSIFGSEGSSIDVVSFSEKVAARVSGGELDLSDVFREGLVDECSSLSEYVAVIEGITNGLSPLSSTIGYADRAAALNYVHLEFTRLGNRLSLEHAQRLLCAEKIYLGHDDVAKDFPDWSRHRRNLVKDLISLSRRARHETDPNWSPHDARNRPVNRVPPPRGYVGPPYPKPSQIADDVIRAEYERRIEVNNGKREAIKAYYLRQRIYPDGVANLVTEIHSYYSWGPRSPDELERILAGDIFSDNQRDQLRSLVHALRR